MTIRYILILAIALKIVSAIVVTAQFQAEICVLTKAFKLAKYEQNPSRYRNDQFCERTCSLKLLVPMGKILCTCCKRPVARECVMPGFLQQIRGQRTDFCWLAECLRRDRLLVGSMDASLAAGIPHQPACRSCGTTSKSFWPASPYVCMQRKHLMCMLSQQQNQPCLMLLQSVKQDGDLAKPPAALVRACCATSAVQSVSSLCCSKVHAIPAPSQVYLLRSRQQHHQQLLLTDMLL